MLRIDIITLFPGMFEPFRDMGIIAQARKKNLLDIRLVDLREFAVDKHGSVDDTPYGGGAGMILRPEPVVSAVRSVVQEPPGAGSRLIMLTPQGSRYDQQKAKELAGESTLVLICGHYKGFDERIREILEPEEISIGDYVLSGGETAAMVISDSIVRLLPGVLGNFDSAEGDSFYGSRLDAPWYTRPENFEGRRVPEVLLSGHHARINEWRVRMAEKRTAERRPDLCRRKNGILRNSESIPAKK